MATTVNSGSLWSVEWGWATTRTGQRLSIGYECKRDHRRSRPSDSAFDHLLDVLHCSIWSELEYESFARTPVGT